MTSPVMDSKLTLGTVIAILPLVGALFFIDSRYLAADEGRAAIKAIKDGQQEAVEQIQADLDNNYGKLRIGLAELRIEGYQLRLDDLLLLPDDPIQNLYRTRQIQILERGIERYEEIINRERRLTGSID